MFKKINFILVLLLLLVSVGAVSAAEDLNETVGSDGAVFDEISSEDALTSNDDGETYSSESSSYTVNASNYNTYFNSKGEATSSVKSGDTINIDGKFSNKNFTFKTPVNIIGAESNDMKNCVFTFYGEASGSNISSLKIVNNHDYYYGIFLNSASNCIIHDCFINNTGHSSYTICLGNGANNNNVTNNNLNAYGITYGHGTRSTSPIIISGSHNNYIANNVISCWDANGIYLSNYPGGPLKGGASNFNVIYNNSIKYNVLPTSWSYGIQIMGSNNIIKSNKVVGAYRGISISGSRNSVISNQIINLTGADYNHPNEEIAGESAIVGSYYTIIANNSIINSKVQMSGAGITALDHSIIENNYVQVTYRGNGINPLGSNITIKKNNISTISGSGILVNSHVFNLIFMSNIISSQSGIGILIQKLSSKRMPGNITIVDNTVYAGNSKLYAIDARDADKSTVNLIEDNYVPKGYGDVATPLGVFDASKPSYKFDGKTHIINSSNFNDYIHENGALNSNISKGDILIFEGEFKNKLNIIVNNAVKIVGRNAIFYNTTFKVYDNGVWIENLVIRNNKSSKLNAWGILVYQVRGATILNCDIEVNDPNAAYAVYVVESSDVDVINNTLYSEGNYLTYTLLAYTVDDCKFINNTIKTYGTGNIYMNTGMDACVDGDESCLDGNENCLDGNDTFNGNHVVPAEVYRTYGILMLFSSDNIVSGNNINASSKLNDIINVTQSTNSIIGIDLYYNSHNNLFSNNEIYIKSNDNYIYGMGVLGQKSTDDASEGQGASNNQFINNKINLEGTYFVEGFVIGRNSIDTLIISNTIYAKSDCVNYGVNLEMSQNSIINNNKFTLNSDIIYGIQIYNTTNNNISNNDLTGNAKKVYGIVLSNSVNNNICGNVILANSTDEQINFNNYDSIPAGNAGIFLKLNSSNNIIKNNNISSEKSFSIVLDEDAKDNIIQNNYLDSELGIGDDAVNTNENNIVEYNYKYLVTGKLHNIHIKYLENGTFEFETDDENLNGAKIDFIDDYFKIINSTTISNGSASFVYDFNGFKDHTPARYIFYSKVYQKNYKVTEFMCYVDISEGVLIVSLDNVTGAIARNAQFKVIVKNILSYGVFGINVEFYANDEGYEIYLGKAVTDKDGLAIFNGVIPQIYGDNPKVIAKINNPNHFQSTSVNSNLTAFWLTKTNIALNNKVQPGGVVAVLTDQNGNLLVNKDVVIKIGNNIYYKNTNSKGEITMPILSKGTYITSISFEGDEQYYDSKNTDKIIILPSLFENRDYSTYYGNIIVYKVRVKGLDGKYGVGNVVSIKVNGHTYKVNTDKNGYATKTLKLKVGSYTIASEFNGDKVINKITVKPTLTAKNIIKKKAKKIKFSVKVVNKNGKAVKNKKVTFKIKGKKYSAKTNKKGVATVSIKNLKVGKFTITSSYGGFTIKNTIKIKK